MWGQVTATPRDRVPGFHPRRHRNPVSSSSVSGKWHRGIFSLQPSRKHRRSAGLSPLDPPRTRNFFLISENIASLSGCPLSCSGMTPSKGWRRSADERHGAISLGASAASRRPNSLPEKCCRSPRSTSPSIAPKPPVVIAPNDNDSHSEPHNGSNIYSPAVVVRAPGPRRDKILEPDIEILSLQGKARSSDLRPNRFDTVGNSLGTESRSTAP